MLYDTILISKSHGIITKTIEIYTTMPKANVGLWVIIMCQCSLILGNKYTILLNDVYDGKNRIN